LGSGLETRLINCCRAGSDESNRRETLLSYPWSLAIWGTIFRLAESGRLSWPIRAACSVRVFSFREDSSPSVATLLPRPGRNSRWRNIVLDRSSSWRSEAAAKARVHPQPNLGKFQMRQLIRFALFGCHAHSSPLPPACRRERLKQQAARLPNKLDTRRQTTFDQCAGCGTIRGRGLGRTQIRPFFRFGRLTVTKTALQPLKNLLWCCLEENYLMCAVEFSMLSHKRE